MRTGQRLADELLVLRPEEADPVDHAEVVGEFLQVPSQRTVTDQVEMEPGHVPQCAQQNGVPLVLLQ